jgi:lipoprotein-anchoring transpeptidase ErfK/SrfK
MRWRRLVVGLCLMGSIALVISCWMRRRPSPDNPLERGPLPPIDVEEWLRDDRFEAPSSKGSSIYSTALIANRFDAWAYTKMHPRSQRLGSVRLGSVLWGTPQPSHRGCAGGWYALAQGGYACASGSFRRLDTAGADFGPAAPVPADPDVLAAALDAALPYRYVQVSTKGAPRFHRIPTPNDEAAAWMTASATAGLDVRMIGDYFLAVAGEEVNAGRRFLRTLRSKFVRAEDVTATTSSALHGVKNPTLPLAFIMDADVPTFRIDEDELQPVGTAPRYSRLPWKRSIMMNGSRFEVVSNGVAVSADAVRVARQQPRPTAVGAHEKWIAVDLSDQTLVAYEGERAVFATLISSGKPGHETPTGVFRIRHKHVSTTMRGEDPVDGPYEVEEVPWTMYYSGGYALHGAYWHDQFGRVRSHGCTNLAPADARWLLRWTDPPLPAGWHSIRPPTRDGGTRVYINE